MFDFIYLNAPKDEAVSESGTAANIKYASLSMQGWRRTQEDAMSCVLKYRDDETSSLFGVYDGHGGPEIAVYVRNRLPDVLNEQIAESSNIEKALVKTFLCLDEELKKTDSKQELIEILQTYVDDCKGDNIQRVLMAMRLEHLKAAYCPQSEDENSERKDDCSMQSTSINNGDNKHADNITQSQEPNFSQDAMACPGTSGTSKNCDASSSSTDESKEMEDSSGSEGEAEGPFELIRMSAPEVDLMESDPDDSDYNPESDESGENDSEDERHVLRDMEASVYSGTTATVALIRKNTLYVANAGDSRCVVSRNYKAIGLTEDHKPENPGELKRILGAGGEVNDEGRINDGLNLSRAIGDFVYKSNDKLPPESQMVTCVPDVNVYKLTPEDRFMVLACDGIWNSMTSQEIVDYVNLRLDSGPVSLVKVCEEIVYHILPPDPTGDGTGLDNMSIIIVVFGEEQAMETS